MTTTVLITDYDLPGNAAEEQLTAAGYLVRRSRGTRKSDLIEAGQDADALLVQWAPITADVIDALPRLRIISRLGIGYDMIDVEAATQRGIAVANTPSYCIEEVASHSIAMIMALARGLGGYDDAVRRGIWAASCAVPMALRPSEATVGVIGYGRIGSSVARACAALGFSVLVADPYVPKERVEGSGHRLVSIDEALCSSDLISLHLPLTEETFHLVDEAAIASMRPGAAIVNTCRGPLVDEDALARAITSGRLSGAAMDVFAKEPLPPDSPLRGLAGVMLSPHAAWYSAEALTDLPLHAAANIIDFISGKFPDSIINRDYAGVSAENTRRL